MTQSDSGQGDLVADLLAFQAELDTMPSPVRGIRAHHAVPFGSAFRQWDTNGELWVWANAGEIADLPVTPGHRLLTVGSVPFGIPVYTEAFRGF